MAKTVYSTLKEIVSPEHTALIVWDVQKMLVERIFNKEEFMGTLQSLVESARRAAIPIFFTKITPLPERFESGARRAMARNWGSMANDASAFELAIQPKEGEIVINKNTASVFVGTNFELMARNAGIEAVVLTGIATEIGVESTARDALNRGFYAVVAKDAVSSGDKEAHERSLANMQRLLTLAASEELMNAWESKNSK
ncbi:MAG: isochorismatase family cysteine hydrolase [Candidatus Micrarchaeaceae archaeon]